MNPFTKGLYNTTHLITMLYGVNQKKIPKLLPQEQATLLISRQILFDAGLTVPELSNYLKWLGERGYVEYVVVFDDMVRSEVDESISGKNREKINRAIDESEKNDNDGKFNRSVIEYIRHKVPAGEELDEEAILSEKLSPSKLSSEGFSLFKKLRPDEISIIILIPFRNIYRLHERIGNGEKPEDIRDEGIRYDSDRREFYISEEIISTSYNGKPNTEHYVLLHFEYAKKTGKIPFDKINGFRPDIIRRAMYRFIEKQEHLKDIFKIHTDHVEVFTGRNF